MNYDCRNPVRMSGAEINVEWNHPTLGWIIFTASADDCEPHGREIYALAAAGEFGPVAGVEQS